MNDGMFRGILTIFRLASDRWQSVLTLEEDGSFDEPCATFATMRNYTSSDVFITRSFRWNRSPLLSRNVRELHLHDERVCYQIYRVFRNLWELIVRLPKNN